MKMLKRVMRVASLALCIALPAQAAEKLVIGATAVPHAEMLEFIKPKLAEEGVELTIKVFADYVQPNVQLAEKRLDANFFQHQLYLDEFNRGKGTDLVTVARIHVEPFGAYSAKVKAFSELPQGGTVILPNDPSNGGRALLLLDREGVIKLKDSQNPLPTVKDIVENPKQLKFKELEAATLPRVFPQVELALINTNYALAAKLNPLKDAIALESKDSPYANIIATRPDNRDSPAVKKLVKQLTSESMRKFIEEKYKGAVIPAF